MKTELNIARRRRILLVDDDAPARVALERALLEANYGVVSAHNSRDALSQLQQNAIDIALLGLGHDAGNDWNTVESLTQYQPRLLLIVAGSGSEGFAHPLASTAEALLEKPIDLSLLFETLKGLPACTSTSDRTLSGLASTHRCND